MRNDHSHEDMIFSKKLTLILNTPLQLKEKMRTNYRLLMIALTLSLLSPLMFLLAPEVLFQHKLMVPSISSILLATSTGLAILIYLKAGEEKEFYQGTIYSDHQHFVQKTIRTIALVSIITILGLAIVFFLYVLALFLVSVIFKVFFIAFIAAILGHDEAESPSGLDYELFESLWWIVLTSHYILILLTPFYLWMAFRIYSNYGRLNNDLRLELPPQANTTTTNSESTELTVSTSSEASVAGTPTTPERKESELKARLLKQYRRLLSTTTLLIIGSILVIPNIEAIENLVIAARTVSLFLHIAVFILILSIIIGVLRRRKEYRESKFEIYRHTLLSSLAAMITFYFIGHTIISILMPLALIFLHLIGLDADQFAPYLTQLCVLIPFYWWLRHRTKRHLLRLEQESVTPRKP